MTAKRFTGGSYGVYDNYKEDRLLWTEWEEVTGIMNNLDLKARERGKALSKLQKENEQLKTTIQQLTNDNTKQKKKLNTAMKEIEQLKEHQRTLEAKIVRLKDRVKTFEKHYSLKDIERYKKMDNCNCIDSRRLEE